MEIKEINKCRCCGSEVKFIFSLGNQFISDFIDDQKDNIQVPLDLVMCENPECRLLQLKYNAPDELMWNDHYGYKSNINSLIKENLRDIVSDIERMKYIKETSVVVDIGCFPKGTPILNENIEETPIENINVGDKVITHKGNIKTVKKLFKRKYKGTFYNLKSQYHFEFKATEEHPILSLKKNEKSLKPVFRKISELNVGDYISIPRKIRIKRNDIKDVKFARLLGWYLAEGSRIYSHKPKLSGINITIGINNKGKHLNEILQTGIDLGATSVKVHRREDKSTFEIHIYGKELAERIIKYGGVFSDKKKLHKNIFGWSEEEHKEMLRAYFNGDGHYRKKHRCENYTVSSASRILINQIRMIFIKYGICPSYHIIDGSKYNKNHLKSYRLSLCGRDCDFLLDGLKKGLRNSKRYKISKDYIFIPILSLKKSNEIMNVYNFEVQSDNSYLVGGISVHNCNDGTLLDYYTNPSKKRRIGFEPCSNVAEEAEKKEFNIIRDYFNAEAFNSNSKFKADVITAISMFYDLDNPNQFLQDIKSCLKEDGLFVIQQNYLKSMLEQNAFDNICHEHRTYYSLKSLNYLLEKNGLEIVDVSFNNINGGSIRTFITHKGLPNNKVSKSVKQALQKDIDAGLDTLKPYEDFAVRIRNIKAQAINFLKEQKRLGKKVFGVGASTRGNTTLQYFGITPDLLIAIGDFNKDKWGKKTPGTLIPIMSPDEIKAQNPDYQFVLIWHLFEAIKEKEIKKDGSRESNGIFVIPMPEFKVIK